MPYVCIGCDELKRLVQVKSTFGTSELELHVELPGAKQPECYPGHLN